MAGAVLVQAEFLLVAAAVLAVVVYGASVLYARHWERVRRRELDAVHGLDTIKPIEANFDYKLRPQNPYRPFKDGPYHVTMGLKKTDVENWIELDDTYLEKYKTKKALFRDHRDETLRYMPGLEEALFEGLWLLKDVLVRRYPTMFMALGPYTIQALVTGDVWDLSRDSRVWEKHHPFEVMGLLATEDFFILTTDEKTQETTLRGGSVCFPAGWKIEERLGLSLWQIHAGKVPHYEQKLAKSMDRFFYNMKPGSPIARFNFAIDDSADLFRRHSHHNLTEEQLAHPIELESLHLRVERQFLQRLPRTNAFLFTIRTYVTPITEVTRDLDAARALRTNVDSYGEEVAKYKNKALWDKTFQRHVAEVLGEKELVPEVLAAAA